ncbi:PREDICTED: uncharacterized protein LOC105954001 [Erythranthe guttata]|uniref:uncharacterized protein LOC105954001 n=1 Tax=Erythranthe guttata TaxID=4155 RepID=UPI00064DD586|nr:PREDICTED: uncharacterized protein LOC105954001 [Erythranthe guttata]|eukprot:XP_012833128.1 PREDICTED: uncharacterized protein LOC105954001 [Erythranthe guttata]
MLVDAGSGDPSRLPLVVGYRMAVVQELLREAAPAIEVREDVLPKSAASRLENEKRKKSENKLRKRGHTDDFRNRAASEIKQKEKNAAMGLEENKRTAPFRVGMGACSIGHVKSASSVLPSVRREVFKILRCYCMDFDALVHLFSPYVEIFISAL